MFLTRGRDGASCDMLTYNGSNSEIFFKAKLDAEVFNVPLGDVRAAISPTHATVQIDSDFVTTPLRFGPAPDGSHVVWHVDSKKKPYTSD